MSEWEPLGVDYAVSLFSGLRVPWWVAGGHALDLFAGCRIREHEDLDVGVSRSDWRAVREHLRGCWDLRAAFIHEKKIREVRGGLGDEVDCLWCRPEECGPWFVELLLMDTERGGQGHEWVFRRNRSIRRPMREILLRDPQGPGYLAPEVQLLFKAKNPRLRDETDFEAVAPLLACERREWLAGAIREAHGRSYPWLPRL